MTTYHADTNPSDPGPVAPDMRPRWTQGARAGSALAIAGLLLLRPALASALAPGDLCTGNPCNVSGSYSVPAGSRLDFGASTALRLRPSAVLTVGSAPGARVITLVARSIVLEPGARIMGNGDDAVVVLQASDGDIDVQSAGTTLARIVVRSDAGTTQRGSAGTISLDATGNLTVSGLFDAGASGPDATGGSIDLTAGGSVAISRDLVFGATGPASWGGSLSITAATGVAVNGALDGSGPGQGGEVSVESESGAVVLSRKVDLSGGAPDGSGGTVDVAAGGDVTLGQIVATGGSGSDGSCGDGGSVTVVGGGSVTVNGGIALHGGTECSGGTLDVTAASTFTQATGVTIGATGTYGGGEFDLRAGGDTVLRSIDLSGRDGGGALDVLSTAGRIEVAGVVDASGTGIDSTAGTISIQGCNVTVAASGKLLTNGDFHLGFLGFNRLIAGGTLTIAGQLKAESMNELVLRSGTPSLVAGSAISPAPVSRIDSTLPSCTLLAVCGDGVLDPGEASDDGGNVACDGCSADCKRIDRICGDGVTECGETCDDGNTVSGDGCEADCRLLGIGGARWVGTTINHGCFAQWDLAIDEPRLNPNTGFPALDQYCLDGDDRCDRDGRNDLGCGFQARICVRGNDPRLADCTASVGSITDVVVKSPSDLNGGNAIDRANTTAIADALRALGGTVRVGSTSVQSGPPIAAFESCTAPFQLRVPRTSRAQKVELFNLGAHDSSGATMDSVRMRLHCLPNDSVCGNGILETTEACDDGNLEDCDGCSSRCRMEACGDGVVQCSEECDDGSLNGAAESTCTSNCTRRPPDLRIPGGGSKTLDCGHEFAMMIDPDQVRMNARGIPRNDQVCVDNDPSCDLDPAPGTCRLRLWSCLGGGDDRLSCRPAEIGSWQVIEPKSHSTGRYLDARNSLLGALDSVPKPAGPGETCSERYHVVVPVEGKGLRLKPKVTYRDIANGDPDTLRLRCLPGPKT